MSKLRGFDSYVKGGGEDFNSYVECFDHYWKVMQIEDCNLKKSAFIMALGKSPYKTFKDLLLPATPEDKSFEDVVNVLKEHYGVRLSKNCFERRGLCGLLQSSSCSLCTEKCP